MYCHHRSSLQLAANLLIPVAHLLSLSCSVATTYFYIMAGYWRSGRGILSHEQREREDAEAARRLASIGATPAARGQPATLGPGYTRRGDLIFGTDVRKGDYIPNSVCLKLTNSVHLQ